MDPTTHVQQCGPAPKLWGDLARAATCHRSLPREFWRMQCSTEQQQGPYAAPWGGVGVVGVLPHQ